MSKCANHKMLATLAFVLCRLSQISIHIYAKNSLNIQECPNVKLISQWVHTKAISTRTFTKLNIFDVHETFALKWQALIWSQHPHMSPQHNNNMITPQFDLFFFFFTRVDHLPISTGHELMGRYPCWLDV